jgi:hypothetical protein
MTRLVTKIEGDLPPRGRRKKDQPPPEMKSTSRDVFDEIMHLPAEAGQELLDFLRRQKSILLEMAKRDVEERQEAWRRFLEDLLRWWWEQEMRELDFSQRNVSWERTDVSRWTCQGKLAEGCICLEESLWYWHACVKRGRRIAKSQYVLDLKMAVEWVENEANTSVDEQQPDDLPSYAPRIERVNANRVRLQQKLSRGP